MNTDRFKSTLFSTVLFYSRFHPEAVAVAFGPQEVSYADFARDIERATRQLVAKHPSRSGLAMVAVTHPYLHWVLTMALGRVGMTSVTAYDAGSATTLALIKPDVVFVDAQAAAADARFVRVSDEWIGREADQLPPFIDPEHRADAPVRLILSSGTTGIPKKVLLTHGMLQHRIETVALNTSMTAGNTRNMVLVGLDTIAGYQYPLATWLLGGRAVLLMHGEDPYRTIVRKGVNYAFMAPVQLEQIIRTMPAGAWPTPELTVAVGGSALSRRLSEQARACLTPSLLQIYGSTEAGLVTRSHAGLMDSMPGATGLVQPAVDLEIVDEAHQVLPHGQIGAVRFRSPDCITSYLDAPPSDNDEVFRDGWFYPGDAGVLTSTGILTIVGRTTELLNFGGAKFAPNLIEDALAACPGVTDVAAFALEQDGQVATPWVAVVRGEGYEQALLEKAFKQAFPRLPAVKFVNADVIPRNQMGKVQRNLIREQVQRAVEDQGPAKNSP